MNSSNYAITILLGLCLIGAFIGGAFAYRAFEGTRTVIITEHVNVDSLSNVLLAGKVDSVRLSDLFKENERLRNRVDTSDNWLKSRVYPIPNNTSTHTWIFDSIKSPQVLAYSADTVLHAEVIAQEEGDTAVLKSQIAIAEKIQFIPAFNLFRIEDLAISPISLPIRTKKVTEPTIPSLFPSFHVDALLSFRDAPGAGILAWAGKWGVGVDVEIDRKPMWMVSHRF